MLRHTTLLAVIVAAAAAILFLAPVPLLQNRDLMTAPSSAARSRSPLTVSCARGPTAARTPPVSVAATSCPKGGYPIFRPGSRCPIPCPCRTC